jgi:16S rRNA (guanine527-N7)-methyltransferase
MIREYVHSPWDAFAADEKLTAVQIQQFRHYYALLASWNVNINLTAITREADVVVYHFQDSLQLGHAVNLASGGTIADVGAGAGFPSLPLKIVYPHLTVVLIEVNTKRIRFLQAVIQELDLQNVHISTLDWRTFLRKTEYQIDYFCARASLAVPELLAFCKPSCRYRASKLVYWASDQWEATIQEKSIIESQWTYVVGTKKRKLVVFSCIGCII